MVDELLFVGALGGHFRDNRLEFGQLHLKIVLGGEHNCPLGGGLGGGDLCPSGDEHGRFLRRRKPKCDGNLGRDRAIQRDAQHVQKLDVVPARHLVHAVEHHVRHPREQLNQRHAGVAHVVVSPLFAILRDAFFGLVDNILKTAVVEDGGVQTHGTSGNCEL